ncbi:ester cyclase [Hymenobacter negativus]|uniref:Ester cyclase n=1 Tax=Hymenobacter negativus TaxID=2795026 RepID=A0ABS3QII8_9BACT|nr:ester cyclase [Hymenobacter negativus]MBO2011057.1 ester cyclase [Hymenobacter negativus]
MKTAVIPGLLLSSIVCLGGAAHAQQKIITSPVAHSKKQVAMPDIPASEKNKAVVRKLYEDILNPGQLDLLPQVVADEYVGAQGEHGPTGLAATIRPVRAAFPDISWTVESLLAEGDQVVVRWSWTGTHQGAFRSFAATHRPVTNSAIAIYQLRNFKIVRSWMQSDRLGFLQQIGALPPELAAQLQPPSPPSR